MTDTLTPGYFQKVKSGEPLPVNDMTRSGIEIFHDEVNIDYDLQRTNFAERNCARYKGYVRGSFPWSEQFNSSAPSISSSALLTEALSAANSQNWDILTFAAEFHKTKDLVRGATERFGTRQNKILDIMSKRRRRRRPNYGEIVKEFSDMWLEFRYGWRILSYDIESANTAITSLDDLGKSYTRVTRSETSSGPVVTSSPTRLYGSQAHTRFVCGSEREVRAGVCVKLDINSPVSIDPLVTAYEVLPWSFILDWFVNVGDNINAYSPFAMGSLAWSFVSSTHTQTCDGQVSVGYNREADWSGRIPWTSALLANKVTASRTSQNPAFSLEFRPNLDLFKGADLAAIAWGIYTRRLRALRRISRM